MTTRTSLNPSSVELRWWAAELGKKDQQRQRALRIDTASGLRALENDRDAAVIRTVWDTQLSLAAVAPA